MKTETLIFLIYLSDALCLHITPWSVLGYLRKTAQIWQEFLQIWTTFNSRIALFFPLYLLQIEEIQAAKKK